MPTATLTNCNLHKKYHQLKFPPIDLWTWDGVIEEACVEHVDHNYLLYRSVDYDDCLAQFSSKYVLKEEQHQAVLGFTGAKGCCGGSSKGFCEKCNLAVVRGSETQTKSKERWIVVASLLRGIINDQVEAMREADISAFALPCSGTMRWCGHFLFLKPKAIIVVLAFLKAGFNKRKSSSVAYNLITARRQNPTWLIFCLRNGKTKIS